VAEATAANSRIFRGLTGPIALVVAVVVVAAWVVTWASSDFVMAVMGSPLLPLSAIDLALFFGLLVVMMVAMMLPAAVPMIISFRGLTKLEEGRPVRPADDVATAIFVLPYFLVWGGFSLGAVLALVALGFGSPMAPRMSGPIAFVPAVTLIVAGGWQVTHAKEVCLSHCQSPMGFVMQHWRSGHAGAFRMGMRHALYCIGCCWLFMVVLFVAGAMSLVWMGGLSVAIFVEKVGIRRVLVSRAIGVVLVALGVVLAYVAFVAM
jgi:predicted metal-binding membrane protein